MRPLGDRVLIKPDVPPEVSASGLIVLVEHKKPEQTGTVVAVGQPVHPRQAEAMALASTVEDAVNAGFEQFGSRLMDVAAPARQAATLLRDVTRREPSVQPGDYVIFSWNVGQEIILNDGDERYLLMREADILAVVE